MSIGIGKTQLESLGITLGDVANSLRGQWDYSSFAGSQGSRDTGLFGLNTLQGVGSPGPTTVSANSSNLVAVKYQTGTIPPSAQGFTGNTGINTATFGNLYRHVHQIALQQVTGCRLWVGYAAVTGKNLVTDWATDVLAFDFVGFRYTSDTTWKAIYNLGGAQQVVDCSVSVNTSPHLLEIRYDGGDIISYFIDGIQRATISTKGALNNHLMAPSYVLDNKSSGTGPSFQTYYWRGMWQASALI